MEKDEELLTNQLIDVTGTTNRLMVSFFRDAEDEEYFMIVNKRNARDPNGDDTDLIERVTLDFSGETVAVQRLDRRSGIVENVILKDNRYILYLPGGTGELFKYKTGKPFVGITN